MIGQLAPLLSFTLLATGCTFLLQTVATHSLAPAEYGRFARWLTDLSFWGLFFILGLDNSILYFSKHRNDFSQNAGVNVGFFAGLLSLYLVILHLLSVASLYNITLGIAIFSLAVYQTLNAANQHAENFQLYGAFALVRALVLLLPFVAVFIFGVEIDATKALLIYSAASAALVVFIFIYFSARQQLKLFNFAWRVEYFWYGIKSMTSTFLAVTLYTATIYCIDFLGSPAAVAYFFLAAAISKLAWVLPDTVGNILYPKYLRIGVDRTKSEVMADTYHYAQVVFLVNVIFFLCFVFLGRWVISLLYAPGYSSIYIPTCIMLIGNQGMVFYKILGRYFASQDRWGVAQRALIFGCVANLALNFALIPPLGVIGAATATAVSFWVCGLSVALRLEGSFLQFLHIPKLFRKLRDRCI